MNPNTNEIKRSVANPDIDLFAINRDCFSAAICVKKSSMVLVGFEPDTVNADSSARASYYCIKRTSRYSLRLEALIKLVSSDLNFAERDFDGSRPDIGLLASHVVVWEYALRRPDDGGKGGGKGTGYTRNNGVYETI